MIRITELAQKFRSMWPVLDERARRIVAASEAIGLGYGGVSIVRRACGLSRKAIAKGIQEIQRGETPLDGRIRRPGGGRKKITVSDPNAKNRPKPKAITNNYAQIQRSWLI